MPVAEVSKDDVDLGDEDLDAGAWGDPDLDIEPGEPGEANGVAEMDHEEGEQGEEAEGGWEMEVRSSLLAVACPCEYGVWRMCLGTGLTAYQHACCCLKQLVSQSNLTLERVTMHYSSRNFSSVWTALYSERKLLS